MRRAVGFCGKLIFWGVVVAGLTAAGALLLVMNHLNEAVRAEVQRVFAEHYSGLHVSVRSAQRVEGQGLFIRGLSIKDPRLEGPQAELLYVDEIFLASENSIDDLVLGELQIDHIALRRLALRAVRRPDGAWSTAQLLPLPDFGGDMPTASVEDGTIEVFDPQRNPPATLTLRRINLDVKPGRAAAGDGQTANPAVLYVEGDLAGDVFRAVKFGGWLDPKAGDWSVAGSIDELQISPETRQSLPNSLASHLTALGNLRGKANLTFNVANVADANNVAEATNVAAPPAPIPYRFDIRGNLYNARYEDPQLPFPLSDISATLHLNNSQLRIDDLSAKGGGAALHFDLVREGWSESSPLRLQARARRLHVDQSLGEVLPAPLSEAIAAYRPSGLLNADVSATFDGQKWMPELTVECLDMSFVYRDFPYPITGATGTISLENNVLSFALEAPAGQQPLQIRGRFERPLDAPAGWLEYSCPSPIPIDARLLAALDTQRLRASRDLLIAMNARGNVSSNGRFDLVRLPSGNSQINEHVFWRLSDASVEYEKFPYPLHHISGEVELWNGQYTFRNFTGRNDSGQVACQGTYTTGEDQPQLTLDFDCRDLPLEDELRAAFPPRMQEVWAGLRPQGSIDRLNLRLRYFPDSARLDLDAAAIKWPEHQGGAGQPISVYPQAFPYRLDQLEGEVRYRNGYIELTRLSAVHGDSRFTVNGFCQMGQDGSWRLQFSRLNTEGLSIDRDLISALPEELAAGIAPLSITGPVTLAGAIEFRRGPRAEDAVASDWDMTLDLENGQIHCGVDLNNIHGAVRLVGSQTAQGFYSRGELDVDSLMYQGIQFTRLKGPVWIDRERVAFGAWADQPQQGQPPRRLTAAVLGGEVAGDIHVALKDDRYFTLQAQLDRADLSQFAREFLPQKRKISGLASGVLRLSGAGGGVDTLRGDGRVWLRKADIYELPVMVALLKILKIKPLDKTAFTSSDVDFRVDGENIYFDRMVFSGDAISLKGAGEVNLDRQVNLKFYTLVGSDSRRIPLIWPLLADASRRILMIEVTGPLDDPVTTRNVLPGLNGTIERLFSEELGAGAGQPRATAGAQARPQYQR